MPKYIVTTMIQSADIDNNEPVQVRWYSGDSLGQAIAALAGAAAHHEDVDARVPAAARYSTLGVTLSIEQDIRPTPEQIDAARSTTSCEDFDPDIEAEFADDVDPDVPSATPSTERAVRVFDTEGDYSLSDCIYWDSPRDTECAGPRVGMAVSMDADEGFIVCEKHFNHPPQ